MISIHAPREGSDLSELIELCYNHISIHAPREGSDDAGEVGIFVLGDFNPRSP